MKGAAGVVAGAQRTCMETITQNMIPYLWRTRGDHFRTHGLTNHSTLRPVCLEQNWLKLMGNDLVCNLNHLHMPQTLRHERQRLPEGRLPATETDQITQLGFQSQDHNSTPQPTYHLTPPKKTLRGITTPSPSDRPALTTGLN